MIPCYICGKDIGGGWCIGFPPARDSQKMGLCKEHDLVSNRKRVQKAWQDLIFQRIDENRQNSAFKAGELIQLLSIYFTGGGSISLPCSSFSIMDDKTLKITTPDGEQIFFPLGQVRNYAVSPLDPHPAEALRQVRELHPQLEPTEDKAKNKAVMAEEPGSIQAAPKVASRHFAAEGFSAVQEFLHGEDEKASGDIIDVQPKDSEEPEAETEPGSETNSAVQNLTAPFKTEPPTE